MTESHPLRRRIDAHRASRTFGTVLVLIVASIVFAASASDGAWTSSVLVLLQGLTLIAALWTSGLTRASAWLTIGLLGVAVGILSAILSETVGGSNLLAAVALVSGLLNVGVVVVIVRSIVRSHEVNVETILGAICVYLMLGMVFLFAFGAVAGIASGPFFAQGTDGTRALRLYFSYVTLATLGYGDYTPASNLGHMLAVAEALMGQIYLVTVVAILVARLRIRPRESA